MLIPLTLSISLCLLSQTAPATAPAVDSKPQQQVTGISDALSQFNAVVASIRAYEASLQGLAWDQEIRFESIPKSDGKSFVSFKNSFVIAPDGR